MRTEDRESLLMTSVIGLLLLALFATPALLGKPVIPPTLRYPVVTIGFETDWQNSTNGTRQVQVAVTPPLGPAEFGRMQARWNGGLVLDTTNTSVFAMSTREPAFLFNVTIVQMEGGQKVMYMFEGRVTVNYTKPVAGKWVPLAVLEYPDIAKHRRFVLVEEAQMPYRRTAEQFEVKP